MPTPAGTPFTQAIAADLAQEPWLVFACGRYEGIDHRVLESSATRMPVTEVSLGDYVLGGGEVAALVVIEAVARLLPGVIGNAESLVEESHAAGLLEGPGYTKPVSWRGLDVPEVLLSGDHARIARWRRDQALRRTAERRPDLLAALDPEHARPARHRPAGRARLEPAGQRAIGTHRTACGRLSRCCPGRSGAPATGGARTARPEPDNHHMTWVTCGTARDETTMQTLDALDAASKRSDIPVFRPGDTLKVHVKVIEGTRSRIQVFQGVVIRRQGGGSRETFTVRKISFGVGVERTFPVHTPVIDKIEVVTKGDVRRAKLYYLRDLRGKAAKIKERRETPAGR